jgi:uncharacterized surface protein with fasciclin (FAS1) repeats
MSTILQIANADRNLSTLMKTIKVSDLEETLSGKGPFTILAPVNLAFGNLAATVLEDLLKPGNNEKLSDMLSYNILAEKRLMKDFINGQKLKTINGKEVNVTVKDGEVRINGARILAKDRQGSNGVVHSVDTVSIPS